LQPEQSRTLIFSQRNLSKILPFRCAHFEFEDVIAEVDSAEILAPHIDPSTRRHAIAKQLAYHTPLVLNPGIEPSPLQANYDLFIVICGNPSDLLRLNAIKGWRNRCKKAICLIDEVWIREIKSYRNYLRMLKEFDLVVLYYSQSVKPVNEVIGEKKCIFLPPGVDTIRFCPYPNPPKRSIDVYSIGRRSAVTHSTYLKMAAEDGFFYLHDSTSADQVLNQREHRVLFANIAKRSRYFIVNPGLIDRPDIRGTQIEIGNRYFEAAASGSLLLGERPINGEFEKFFDWPDALIDLPYNSPDVDKVLKKLDQQPERQNTIRHMNIQQSLLRHDWVYRWEAILKAVGMTGLPQLEARKEYLRSLANCANPNETRRTAASSSSIKRARTLELIN
jgi:glycosyltransferase involved in cell wall biosynthesis